jgi:hypothetical protein
MRKMFVVGTAALASQINVEICSHDVKIEIDGAVKMEKVICFIFSTVQLIFRCSNFYYNFIANVKPDTY